MALAVLFPLSHLMVLFCIKIGFLPSRVWALQWFIGVLNLMALWASFATGQRDITMSSAPLELLSEHKHLAQQFLYVWSGIFLLMPVAFRARRRIWSLLFHGGLLVLLASQLWLAVQLGRVGGKIVFGE